MNNENDLSEVIEALIRDVENSSSPIAETPNRKKTKRALNLSDQIDQHVASESEEEPNIVLVVSEEEGEVTTAEEKQPEIQQEVEAPTAPAKKKAKKAASRRSYRKRKSTVKAEQSTSNEPKPKIVRKKKEPYLCDLCNAEVATAAILRYHVGKCQG